MKKKNNRWLQILLSGSLCLSAICFAGGCTSSQDNESSSNGDAVEEKSEYLISGFNGVDDLYAIKPIGVLPTDAFIMDINSQADFVSEGTGSLKYENVQGAYHEAFLLFEHTSAVDMNAQKISTVSVDVYNPNAETAGFSLHMKTHDGSTLFAEQTSVAAGEWTTVSIDLTEYSYAQKDYIKGVSLRFDVDTPNTFYVDNIVAKMGAEDLPPVNVNEVLSSLTAPEGVNKITEENFDNHVAFVEKVFYAKRLYDADSSGVSSENVAKLNACLAMVEDFGILYDARTDFISRGYYGSSPTVLAAEDATYGGVWSINIPKTSEQGLKHNAISVDGYGKVVYWLYNPMDVELSAGFHGGWNSWNLKKVQLPSKTWTKIELNARYFEYDFKGQVFFVISGAASLEGEFKMTSFFGVTAEVVAKEVDDMITALPALAELTYEDKAAVMAVKAAYEDLSSSAKAAIEDIDKLTDSEAKIYELEAVPVMAMIDALPTADALTSEHGEAVMAAKAAYNALSAEAKAKVETAKVEKLNACYSILSSVILEEKIAMLPSMEEFEQGDGEKYIYLINDAKAEYDGMTEVDKAKVDPAAVEKLQALAKAIENYKIVFEAGKDALTKDGNGMDWTGTITTTIDETYGEVYLLEVQSLLAVDFDFHAKNLNTEGLGKVFFYVYNPAEKDYRVVAYTADWQTSQTTTLTAGEWTKVEVSVADFYKKGGVFYVVVTGADIVSGWKVTSFYGTYMTADPVINTIEALPTVETVTLADRAAVDAAKATYDALGEEERALVTNVEKLNSLIAKLNELESAPVIAMIEALPTLETVTLADKAAVEDARAAYNGLSDSAKVKVTNVNKLILLENKLIDLEAEPVLEMIDALPEVYEITTSDEENIKAAKAAYDNLSEAAKAKVSTEQVEKLKALVEALSTVFISEAIKALPTVDSVSIPKDITVIEEVKAKYDALSETDKAKISAELTEKLNACVAAIEGFATLFDARTETLKANTNTGAASTTANAQTDETYGNVFRLDVVAAAHGQADFFPNVNFSGYERVFFYIYNPGVEGVNLVWYTGSWTNEAGNWTALAANAWTKIEVGTYYSENNAFYLIDKLSGGATYEDWLITSFYGANGDAVAPDVETPDEPIVPDEPASNVLLDASDASNLLSGRDTGNGGVVGTAVDETYGNVWTINVAGGDQSDFHAKSLDIKDYKYVTFYIYNPASMDVALVCYKADWTHVSNTTMKANAWTAVSIDTSVSGADIFFILNTNVTDGEWKVTSFIGADEPLADIETPDVPDEPDPEQTPSAWNGWMKATVSANPFGGDNANQSTGTDDAYGNYIQVSDTSGSVYLYTPWITDRTTYEKLGVYVYNCGTSDVSGYYNDWSTGSYDVRFTLKAGEWTLITFTDHYITCGNNYLYISGTFRFTDVYGFKGEWVETTVSANPFSGDNANQSTGTDATYGDYIEVSDTSGSVYFYTPWITDRTTYEKLGVYVYNCGTLDVSGYYNDWSTGSYDVRFTLKAGEWTLITFTDHYITCGNNYLYISGTFRFSAVYGYKAAE